MKMLQWWWNHRGSTWVGDSLFREAGYGPRCHFETSLRGSIQTPSALVQRDVWLPSGHGYAMG